MYPYPIAHFVDEDGKETKLHQTQHKVLKGGVKSWRAVRAWTRDGDAGRNDESDGHSAKRARETVPDEPAPARPSFPRIRELCGKARVDVMLSDFDGVFRGDARTARTMSCTMDEFLDLADYPGGNRVYLAQAPVPEQIPFHESSPTTSLGNLRQDLDRIPLRFHLREDAPDEYRDETVHSTNLWMSPAGSCSSPHFDDFDNLLCVVAGRKTVVVMDFGYIGSMGTPLSAGTDGYNHSRHAGGRSIVHFLEQLALHRERQAYGNNVLSERFRATPLNGRDARTAWCSFLLDELGVNCKLEYLGPGDALYLPQGFWHVVESEPGTVAVNYWWRSLFSRELECDEIHLTTDYIAARVFRHLVMKGTKHKLTKICEFATDYYYGDGRLWSSDDTFVKAVKADLVRVDDRDVADRLFELQIDDIYMVKTLGLTGCFRAGSVDLNIVSLTLALAASHHDIQQFTLILDQVARADGERFGRRLTKDLSQTSAAILADQFDRLPCEFFQDFYPLVFPREGEAEAFAERLHELKDEFSRSCLRGVLIWHGWVEAGDDHPLCLNRS